jgi:hypothetical protein
MDFAAGIYVSETEYERRLGGATVHKARSKIPT